MTMPSASASGSDRSAETISLKTVIAPLHRRRRLFLILGVLGLLLGIAHFFVFPREYSARFSLLPEDSGGGGMLQGLGQLSGLAGLPFSLPSDQSSLYGPVLLSDHILEDAVSESSEAYGGQTLHDMLGFGGDHAGMTRAIRELRSRLLVRRDTKTGVTAVRVFLPKPEATAHLGERLLAQLDEYFRTTSSKRAEELRSFLDQRVTVVRGELRAAEEALTRFRAANRSLQGSPVLLQDEQRLQREVLVHETVFVELTRQLELAKITEHKDLAVLRVLDRPRVPTRQASPRLTRSALVSLLLALFLGAVWSYSRDYFLPALRRATQ